MGMCQIRRRRSSLISLGTMVSVPYWGMRGEQHILAVVVRDKEDSTDNPHTRKDTDDNATGLSGTHVL